MKFGEKIKSFFTGKKGLSEDEQDDFSDLLIEGDFGAQLAYKTIEELNELIKKNPEKEPLVLLNEYLTGELLKVKKANYPPLEDGLCAILVLGVNGVGKTTTCAKLSNFYNLQYNKISILAALDTFRAAAIDQLKIHGEKLGCRVVAHKMGGDPAAVVFDALEAAKAANADLLIADTAGRMHTKSSLIEELKKIDRVVESKAFFLTENQNAKYLKYLVLDATTGRNAFSQAEVFAEAVKLDGVILTKYDSTAKGGVVFSLAKELNLPVAFVCTGETYKDIEFFDPIKFAKEFTGIE